MSKTKKKTAPELKEPFHVRLNSFIQANIPEDERVFTVVFMPEACRSASYRFESQEQLVNHMAMVVTKLAAND